MAKWKQVESWKDYFPSAQWVYSPKIFVKVWKTGLPLKEMKRRGHAGTYIVKTAVSKRYYKTKSEAMAAAKAYMRKY